MRYEHVYKEVKRHSNTIKFSKKIYLSLFQIKASALTMKMNKLYGFYPHWVDNQNQCTPICSIYFHQTFKNSFSLTDIFAL